MVGPYQIGSQYINNTTPIMFDLIAGTEYVFKIRSDYSINADFILRFNDVKVLQEGIMLTEQINTSACYEFNAPKSGNYLVFASSDSDVALNCFMDGYRRGGTYGQTTIIIGYLEKGRSYNLTLTSNSPYDKSINIMVRNLETVQPMSTGIDGKISNDSYDVYLLDPESDMYNLKFEASSKICVALIQKSNGISTGSWYSGSNINVDCNLDSNSKYYVVVSGYVGVSYSISLSPIVYETLISGEEVSVDLRKNERGYYSFTPDDDNLYVIYAMNSTGRVYLDMKYAEGELYSPSRGNNAKMVFNAREGETYWFTISTSDESCNTHLCIVPAELMDIQSGINAISTDVTKVYRYTSDSFAILIEADYSESLFVAYSLGLQNYINVRGYYENFIIGPISGDVCYLWFETEDFSSKDVVLKLTPLSVKDLQDGINDIHLSDSPKLLRYIPADREERSIRIVASPDVVKTDMYGESFYRTSTDYIIINGGMRYLLLKSNEVADVTINIDKIQVMNLGGTFDWSGINVGSVGFEFDSTISSHKYLAVNYDKDWFVVIKTNNDSWSTHHKIGDGTISFNVRPDTHYTIWIALSTVSDIAVSLHSDEDAIVSVISENDVVLQFALSPDYTAKLCGYSSAETIIIPEFIIKDGRKYVVTGIDESLFMDDRVLREISIPSTVSHLEYSLFYNCSSLISVNLPYGLVHIDTSAFGECRSLKEIIIPESVQIISDFAFYGCLSLQSISIPNEVYLSNNSFYEMSFVMPGSSQEIPLSQIPGYKYVRQGSLMVRDHEYGGHAIISSTTDVVSSGYEVEFTLSLSESFLKSLSVKIDYDSDLFDFISASWLVDGTIRYIDENHHAIIAWDDAVKLEGDVLKFKLKAKGTMDISSVKCNVVFNSREIDMGQITKTIMIIDYVPGDVNNDGLVTSDDAIYLLYYTFDPDGHPINQNGDFNRDGYVTSDDAIYLLYHTFNPDDYPLLGRS